MADFWIGSKIGRGPVGTSYEGMLKADRRPVVVKVVSRRFDEYPELIEGILADLNGWVGFEHANVASTRMVTHYQERRVVIYDKAPGEPLEEYLRERGPLEPRMALLVIRDVSLALALAHEGDVPAGDIRSSKIYFDGRRAVLTDLGQHRASAMGAGFGRFGVAFGHPGYLAPEVLQQGLKLPTTRTDTYALGVLFYELLTGALPFAGEVRELLRAHGEQPIEAPPAIASNQALRTLLHRLTAKDPAKRLARAQQVVDGLYQLVGTSAPPQRNVSLMSTGIWRRHAVEDARESSSEWTAERVENAEPVGPDLSAQTGRWSSARLPQALMQSAELPTPEAEPAPGAVNVPSASEGVGDDWDQVKLVKQLGRGPCGALYEGTLAYYNAPVIVKVLSSKFNKGAEGDLRRKIMTGILRTLGMAGANTMGPVRITMAGERDLIVFEKVEGRSLRKTLVDRTRIPHGEAMTWILQLAASLERAADRRVHHGDIRPEKVFIDAQGRARLCDYGFANAACLGSGYGQIGLHFGNPTYLAPEVIQESQEQPNFAADAYALGILFYEMVSGMPPFMADSPRKTLVMHLEKPLPPPPRKIKVPSVVGEMILSLSAKDPRRRPASPEVLIAQLLRCQKQVRLAQSGEDAPPVEEFDPTSMGNDGTSGMWSSEEVDPKEKSADWTANKIEEAEAIGPDGLDESMWQSEEFNPDSPFQL